jgi:hypothetical protein
VQAVTGNRENIVVTNSAGMIAAFNAEFAKLWQEFKDNRI